MKQNIQKRSKYVLMITGILVLPLIFVFPAQASEINAGNVIKYVNEAREKENIPDLKISSRLTEVATAKINDMVTHKYFAHTSPEGITPWHWFEKSGYAYKYAGENLAINYTSAEEEQAAWMNSPTHRKNIMNSNYIEIGVAVAVGEINGAPGIIAVQEFGAPAYSGTAIGKKDFISNNDNTLPDLIKFTPVVLSTDSSQKINSTQTGGKITTSKNNQIPLVEVRYYLLFLLFAMIVLPILIARIIYLGNVFRKKYILNVKDDSREYFHKLKIKNYDKCQIIKVRVFDGG